MQALGAAVSAAVRTELDRIGMTQEQLARLMGVYESWLSRRLSGRTPITVDDLERIATAMGWSPDELVQHSH